MTLEDNIGYQLAVACVKNRTKPAIVSGDMTCTYGQLEAILAGCTLELKERGLRQGGLLGLVLADTRLAMAAFGAVSLLGAHWVDATPAAQASPDLDLKMVFSHRSAIKHADHDGLIYYSNTWTTGRNLNDWLREAAPKGYASPDQTARIGQSSGTTGEPKFVKIPDGDNSLRVHWAPQSLNMQQTVLACLFPPTSGFGATLRLNAVISGGTIVEAPLTDPAQVWAKHGVNVVIGSAAQLNSLLHHLDPNAPKIARAVVGGSRPSPELLDRLSQYFENVSISYGSTEMGAVAESKVYEPTNFDGRLHVLPEQGLEVEIVDETGLPIDTGTEGLLRMRRSNYMLGYKGAPDANAKAFQDGWFYPGDLAVSPEPGSFIVTGRENDVLNLGGVKMNAVDIDDQLIAMDEVKDGYCFVLTDADGADKIGALVVLKDSADPATAPAAIMAQLASGLPGSAQVLSVAIVSSLPRTPMGKPIRREAAKLAADMVNQTTKA